MYLHRLAVIAGLITALTACGQAATGEMEKIDKMLQMEIPMAPEDRARAEGLRAEADKLLKEGKNDDAAKALKEAKTLLQRAVDANLINKSDG
ncbi:MAG: hypothetical protein R3231_06390 [bacterium]|nr:hypothetical protein [bacterium]